MSLMKKQWMGGGGEETRIEVSSLVDLSFLLLVFFLVTSTLFAKEGDLGMSVPTDAPGIPTEVPPLVIGIEEDNRVILHPEESYREVMAAASEGRTLHRLESRLRLLKANDRGVQLAVASEANYQRFIDVMNTLSEVGYEDIAIRAVAK